MPSTLHISRTGYYIVYYICSTAIYIIIILTSIISAMMIITRRGRTAKWKASALGYSLSNAHEICSRTWWRALRRSTAVPEQVRRGLREFQNIRNPQIQQSPS